MITSNLKIIGSNVFTIETNVYQTEQLEIINDASATSLKVVQKSLNQNVAEFYNDTNLTFIINSNGNIVGSSRQLESNKVEMQRWIDNVKTKMNRQGENP